MNVYYAVECMRSLRPCGVRTHAKTVEVEIYLHTLVSEVAVETHSRC